MAADSANDLELSLKKRARRRLVGAIALVLLMVIVLPMVLQDRSALTPQQAIKITMPEDVIQPEGEKSSIDTAEAVEQQESVAFNEQQVTIADAPAVESTTNQNTNIPVAESVQQSTPQSAQAESKSVESKPEVVEKVKEKKESKQVKPEAVKLVDKKPVEIKPTQDKPKATENGSFTIQVGVFTDPENVKQLQAKLKQVGFASRTEKITTPKGEKIRLRAGTFASRQEAAYALTKIQAAELTGMVVSN